MSGLSLVTKGFITPTVNFSFSGGDSPIMRKDEHLPKPHIKVINFEIQGSIHESLTNENFTVKTVKIIVDEKD